MTNEESFHSAIDANPRDPTTRLVYADWLEEQGDDRAAYLRLQCQAVESLRKMAELRRALTNEWLDRVDLLQHVFITLRMPEPIDNGQLGEVAEVLVRSGERVSRGRLMFVIHTDKTATEVSADTDCMVLAVLVKLGQIIAPQKESLAILLRV